MVIKSKGASDELVPLFMSLESSSAFMALLIITHLVISLLFKPIPRFFW